MAVGVAIGQAHSAVAQAEATLKRARRNLGYCTIKAPVKGVIIDRRVNIGQTVVASLNAPSLFLIAKDPQSHAGVGLVNEADIGSEPTGPGGDVHRRRLPGETFRGEVNKIRLNAAMTQNVVTYTVEVGIPGQPEQGGSQFTSPCEHAVRGSVSDVLLVPNAALRRTPQADQLGAGARDSAVRAPDRHEGTAEPAAAAHRPGTLFVADGSHARPLEVLVGASDGTMSEVQGSAVAEGTAVVIGELHGEASAPSLAPACSTPMGRARACSKRSDLQQPRPERWSAGVDLIDRVVGEDLSPRRGDALVLNGVSFCVAAGADVALMGASRLGQDHAHEHPRLSRSPQQRRVLARRTGGGRDSPPTSAPRCAPARSASSFQELQSAGTHRARRQRGDAAVVHALANRLQQARAQARGALLERVGLGDRLEYQPAQPRQAAQRVVIAGALVNHLAHPARRRADRQPRLASARRSCRCSRSCARRRG
ncbi:MAG: hypothetical protein U1E76_22700 [Planctomycetota bacterium]